MATWYLDFTNGVDAQSGLAWNLPKLTFAAVNTAATAGDTVLIAKTAAATTVTATFVFTNNLGTITVTGSDQTATFSAGTYIGKSTAHGNGCSSRTDTESYYKINSSSYTGGNTVITLYGVYVGVSETVASAKKIVPVAISGTTTSNGINPTKQLYISGGWTFSASPTQDGETWCKSASYNTVALGGNGTTISYINGCDNQYGIYFNGAYQIASYCTFVGSTSSGYLCYNSGTYTTMNNCVGGPTQSTQAYTGPWGGYVSGSTNTINVTTCIALGFSNGYGFCNLGNYINCNAYNCSVGFMPYTGYTPVWVISNCYAERCRTGFYGGSTTPSTKFISCTAQYGATGFNLVGTSYAESCIANNCTTVGFIPNSSYMKGNATNSCAVGIQCNSYNTFGFVGVYDHISIGDVVGVQQSQYSQNVYLSNCSFTTPTNYAIDKVLTAGLTVCNGCTIDIPSLSKAYHVVTGVNYGIEHYRLQNSFGKNGLVWPNASALQDTTTTPYSLQLVFNGTSGLQYAPFVVGSTYGKSSTAYTVSINYWAPIGSWSGTMIPYLKLNGVTIITGSTISSITATPVTLTFNVTAGMMTDDGQLTIEVVPNCNSVATNWGSLNAVKVI